MEHLMPTTFGSALAVPNTGWTLLPLTPLQLPADPVLAESNRLFSTSVNQRRAGGGLLTSTQLSKTAQVICCWFFFSENTLLYLSYLIVL